MSITLAAYLARQPRDRQVAAEVIAAAARACMQIANQLRRPQPGHLKTALGRNVQGELQKPMDLIANELFLNEVGRLSQVSFAVSEELAEAVPLSATGTLAILFDPLDGSSNLDVNVTVGSIFSIVPATVSEHLLRPGSHQLAAGFAAYGPSTTLVISFGDTSALFALHDDQFILLDPELRIPERTPEIAINTSRQRLWDEGTRRYVDDRLGGTGPLASRYNMRWVGSMVADVHRILTRGGIFLYPTDAETSEAGGRLRLLYEVNPIALIVEAASGAALIGGDAALTVSPTQLHQRVGIALGSYQEVKLYSTYLASGDVPPPPG